jgi:hypothetical protein
MTGACGLYNLGGSVTGNGRDYHWRGRERDINTPSSPNSRISAVVLHLTRGTVAQRHCRSQGAALPHLQDSKGQDLNNMLSWLWLEDIWWVSEHLVAHQSLCIVSPFIVRLYLNSNSKHKRI